MSKLEISNLRHRNSDNFVVEIENLTVNTGEIVCLLGPSGCGKSTTLRLAAGLDQAEAGDIFIGDQQVAGNGGFVPAEDRHVGLVFQDYALFPHLSVLGNVTFGLSDKNKQARDAIALPLLKRMGLLEDQDKYPHMLSGGEQQRVALARALAPNPRLLLMDEPFSGLDAVLRNIVRDETFRILKETSTTVLLVTHDPEEAMRMADRIVLMKEGSIVQQGTPAELYGKPANQFVASFLGSVNTVAANSVDGILETELGQVPHAGATKARGKCDVLIRPEAIRLGPVRGEGEVIATVTAVRNLGPFALIELELPTGRRVTARAATVLQPEEGEICSISLDRRQVFLFPAD
ncbi:MAG: ABC transporter ATP-binding protein [Pseudomonas marincola]